MIVIKLEDFKNQGGFGHFPFLYINIYSFKIAENDCYKIRRFENHCDFG